MNSPVPVKWSQIIWVYIRNKSTEKSWHNHTWRRHQMEAFSALLALCVGNSPVTGEFPTHRPVTRSFDVFFDLCLNRQLIWDATTLIMTSWWWKQSTTKPCSYFMGYTALFGMDGRHIERFGHLFSYPHLKLYHCSVLDKHIFRSVLIA